MQEIKFRAWNKKGKKWVTPDMLDDPQKCAVRVTDVGFRLLNEEESDFIFSQFIGLKDRNGKEIYEGDILTFPETSYHESFHTGVIFRYGRFTTENFLSSGLGNLSSRSEIIGNIYENPELSS